MPTKTVSRPRKAIRTRPSTRKSRRRPKTVTEALTRRGKMTVTQVLARGQLAPLRKTTPQRSRLRPEQAAILRSPLSVNEVEILPKGHPYLPWVTVELRLDLALGVGGWRLMPAGPLVVERDQGSYKSKYDVIMREWIVEGAFGETYVELARALGRHRYYHSNPQIDRGDSEESAKSNALTKSAKRLGVGLELRSRDWCKAFRDTYCVAIWRTITKRYKDGDEWKSREKREIHWRKQEKYGGEPWPDEQGQASAIEAQVIRDDAAVVTEPIAQPRSKQETRASEEGQRSGTIAPPSDPDTPQRIVHVRHVKTGTTRGTEWKLYEATTEYAGSGGEVQQAVYGFLESQQFAETILRLAESKRECNFLLDGIEPLEVDDGVSAAG